MGFIKCQYEVSIRNENQFWKGVLHSVIKILAANCVIFCIFVNDFALVFTSLFLCWGYVIAILSTEEWQFLLMKWVGAMY